MVTTSPKDKKAARQTTKDFERLLNQTQKEVDKILMALKKENQREKLLRERSELLARMLEMMRDRGASDQTLRKALPGLDEFANIISRTGGIAASNQPEHPQPAPTPTEEVLGLLLSEVKTQEIHWLWEKRIPRCYRRKYTSLNHPSSLQHSRYNTAKPSDTTETTETSDTLDTSDTTDTSITFLPLHYAGSV